MASSRVVTGHNVVIDFTPASISDRVLASLIDWLVMILYATTTVMLSYNLDDNDVIDFDTDTGFAFLILLVSLPVILYHPLLEIFNGGRSLGKMAMRTRVVMLDGSAATIGAIMMRWVIYPFDTIATSGLGIVSIMFSSKNQRLGDIAAGTIVIKEDRNTDLGVSLNDFYFVHQGYQPTYPEAADLSLRQIDVISRTIYSPESRRDDHVSQLAIKVQMFMRQLPLPGMTQLQFLQVVVNDYYYYTSVIEE